MTDQTAIVAIVGIVGLVTIFAFAALRGGRVQAKKNGSAYEIKAEYSESHRCIDARRDR